MAKRRSPKLKKLEGLEARLTVTKLVSKLEARKPKFVFFQLQASTDEPRYELRQRKTRKRRF